MELSNIEKLLEKYFEGETTISEEEKLKVYFTGEDVSPDLEKYKPLFEYFSQESTVAPTRNITLKKNRKSWYYSIGIAASIALAVGLFFTKTAPEPNHDLGTYDDPEIALEETKKILNMVSQYMNEGKEGLVYLKEFENTKNKFIK
ncbi:hypothetical protein [Aquimarina algicola]|uniref:Uncharacterized protein n=1 Tax=Aquimarina algicola TaxID=2589995 RepID=A0A504J411_9FLAO|nr:hypothetical protein [Aquimarina algicola]TPN82323.1 hypothetical protein FHK87_23145 [Aquimarina algicola]